MSLRAIVGHRAAVTLLRQAVARQRVPQSLLFAGPEGVGKRTVAVALAQAVNCPTPVEGDACAECKTCRRIARGQHSDVTLLDRGDEASIKIKVIRERVLETVGYRPFEAAKRVYVIDGADDLTSEAQDALLKTLEEPPPSVLLILTTAFPDTLFATIQSRCRRLRFGPLPDTDVARILVERHGRVPAEARVLAAASAGSVSRALAEEAGEFEDDRDAALALLAAARSGSVFARLKAGAVLATHNPKRRARAALGIRLAVVQSLLRDLVAMRALRPVALANSDLETPLRELSSAFDVGRLIDGFAVVGQADQALERNASPKVVADWVAMSL